MKLRVLFDKLVLGEFSNIALGDNDEVSLPPNHYQKIIYYINDALLKIYTRFILKEKEVIVRCRMHITYYHLRKEYAESSKSFISKDIYNPSQVQFHYILDSILNPFEEDLIRILAVHGSDNLVYALNDPLEEYSLFTPQVDVLQVPHPIEGEALSVQYQAKHRDILYYPDDLERTLEQEVNIPFYLEEPLRLYVAYKNYTHMNGQDTTVKAQEYLQLFELMCAEIDQKDIANQTQFYSHDKLHDRGFR